MTSQDENMSIRSVTLKSYAYYKNLPVDFLQSLGLSDVHYFGNPALRIPYLDVDGTEGAVRYRTALEKSAAEDDRFRWKSGSQVRPYGLWRLEKIQEAGFVWLVEGESDCHTIWYHGLPALGIPGASLWRSEWAEYLEDAGKVYVVVEPDGGGETFWERLASSPLRESLWRVELRDL
jgi:putative DNA primase/helicase